MKKMLVAICLLLAAGVLAQDKFSPDIKQGTVLSYTIFVNGQNITSNFSFDSVASDYIRVGWNIDQLGIGSWVMKTGNLNNGVRGYWGQPTAGIAEELPEDQTVLIFSKAQWTGLQKDKKLNFDQQTYTLKQPSEQQQLKLNGKTVDAFLLENQNGSSRIWILNNPGFPILLKIEGNTMGPDLTISSVQ